MLFRLKFLPTARAPRLVSRTAGLCLWMGLSVLLIADPARGGEEQTAAPGGIPSAVPPVEKGSEQTALTGLDNTPEGGTLPGGTVPGGTWPNVTPPGGTVPGGTVPGGTLPGGTFPEETVPGGTLPGGTVPGGTVTSDKLPGEDP